MYLQRLEIYGFKSFAQKTTLDFLTPHNGKQGITSIVGPNGSGKSNVSDAVRWVMGEQSMKALRGKKGEDVIFAGSDKRARLGMAEVSVTLNNEDLAAPIDLSEVVITRRLYRDGESEYLLNGRTARLQDIALLLARARFSQKNYLVIGQGMIDTILRVSPMERKDFFDEAAGVKEFQIKRQLAIAKLRTTQENLQQAEGIVREIEPRLRSLSRQVKRLADREVVEKELRGLQKQYYGQLWVDLAGRLTEFQRQYARLDEQFQTKNNDYRALLEQLNHLEEATVASQEFFDLQKKYEEILRRRDNLERQRWQAQSQLEIDKVRQTAPKSSAPVPLPTIILELEQLLAEQSNLAEVLADFRDLNILPEIVKQSEKLRSRTAGLLSRLKNPNSQEKGEYKPDTQLIKNMATAEVELRMVAEDLSKINQAMQVLSHEEKQKKSQFFELQRQLQSKQSEVHALEQQLNNIKIELAKLEMRKETLEEEMAQEVGGMSAEIKERPATTGINPSDLQAQIFKFKHHLELIGGIDPEALSEHQETQTRYDFLTGQIADLQQALTDTVRAVVEMDKIMRERRSEALQKINDEFNHFFKVLFNGGSAKLIPLYESKTDRVQEERSLASEEADQVAEDASEEQGKKDALQDLMRSFAGSDAREPVLSGIEIQATPPGKKIKDISILSGGERALTSVALICAILRYSPSPFVVLDEVDAALDEANSVRFSEIIDELSERTQFIVITHNRATMSKADVLYGVTMGDDGASKLLSVRLEEAEKVIDRRS